MLQFNLKKFKRDHPNPLGGLQLDAYNRIISSPEDEKIIELNRKANEDATFDLGIMLTSPVLKPEFEDYGTSPSTSAMKMAKPDFKLNMKGPSGELHKLTFRDISERIALNNDYISQGSVIDFLEKDGFDEKYIKTAIIDKNKPFKFQKQVGSMFWKLRYDYGKSLDPDEISIDNESGTVEFYKGEVLKPINSVLKIKHNSTKYKFLALVNYLSDMLRLSDQNSSTLGSDLHALIELLNQMKESDPVDANFQCSRSRTETTSEKLQQLESKLIMAAERDVRFRLSNEVYFPSMLLTSRFDLALYYWSQELKDGNNTNDHVSRILPSLKVKGLRFNPFVLVETKKRGTKILTVHLQMLQHNFQGCDYFWKCLSKLTPGSDSITHEATHNQNLQAEVDNFFKNNREALLNYKTAVNKLIQQQLWLGVSKAILTDYDSSIFIEVTDFDTNTGKPHICLSFIKNLEVDSICRLRTLCFLDPTDENESACGSDMLRAAWVDKFIAYEKHKIRKQVADEEAQPEKGDNQDDGDHGGKSPKRASSQYKVSTFGKKSKHSHSEGSKTQSGSKSGKEKATEPESRASALTEKAKVNPNEYPIHTPPSSSGSEESQSSLDIPEAGSFVQGVVFSDQFPLFERNNIHIPNVALNDEPGLSHQVSLVFSTTKFKFKKFLPSITDERSLVETTCTMKLIPPLLSAHNRKLLLRLIEGVSSETLHPMYPESYEISCELGQPQTEVELVNAIELAKNNIFQSSMNTIENEVSIYRKIHDSISNNESCKKDLALKAQYESYFLANDILNYGFMVDSSISFGPLARLSSPGSGAFILFQDNQPLGTKKVSELNNETLSPEQKDKIVRMYEVLHNICRVIHNDVAARNILVYKDEKESILGFKIIDFGLSYMKSGSINDEDWKSLVDKENRHVDDLLW